MGATTCLGFLFFFVCEPGASVPPPPDTFCQIAKPIRFSANDTRQTKEEVDIHNRKWKAVCDNKTKAK